MLTCSAEAYTDFVRRLAVEGYKSHRFSGGSQHRQSRAQRRTLSCSGQTPAEHRQVRAEYDELLFKHASSQGAKIFDGHKVTSLEFAPTDSARPISADWKDLSGNTGTIAFDYVVDATGRQGLLSTKYHKDRKMTESLRVRTQPCNA